MTQLTIDDINDEPEMNRVIILAAESESEARHHLEERSEHTSWELSEDTREAAIEPPLSLTIDDSGDAVRGVPINDDGHDAADKIRKHTHDLPVELLLTWRIENIAPTPQDIRHTVETVTENGGRVQAMGHDPPLDIAANTSDLEAIRALADAAERNATPRIAPGPPADGGRAGLGYEYVNGHRRKTDNHQHIRAILEAVDEGQMSKRSAANELNTSRSTITRCIEDRRNQYGLE